VARKNLYFNNLTGQFEEGVRDPETHVIHFGANAGQGQVTEAAQQKANELGVDTSQVAGSGQGGRVTVADVENQAG
jgi:pyruvate/2-oxoglutarate dehydrogenase complex dihydrolipoamide acyltransferase (E2) component